MKPMNDILLEELNNSYVGLLVLDIYRPRGTVIIIELGNKNALFRITIYLAYWAFIKNEEEEVLTCFEPRENRDTYKNCLSHLKGTRMERIWFDDDELNLSFSDAFEFNIIEDDEEYGVGSHVVRFSEHNKTDMLCYSTDREWFISGDDEIVSEDTLNSTQGLSLIHSFMKRQRGATVTKVFQTIGSCLIFEMVSRTGRPSSFLVTLCYWGLEYNETIMLNAYEPSENQHIYIRVLAQLQGTKLDEIQVDSDGIDISFSNGMVFFMMFDDLYGPGYDDWITFFEEGYPAVTYTAQRGFGEEEQAVS